MKPIRVQLSRRAGWRKPDNTVVVARPTVWGNPFPIGKLGRAEAVRRFRDMMGDPHEMTGWLYPSIKQIRAKLGGKNLACWCPLPEPGEPDLCHAAILLEIANEPTSD
ncbi:MAG TPA: DUF4326 domain-containing protein [Alphaproteobacteria bacterium]|jgi:hypothetical protein|nr:DUF4326 domain-containing protein [Alphaproteobacteria bacterium]